MKKGEKKISDLVEIPSLSKKMDRRKRPDRKQDPASRGVVKDEKGRKVRNGEILKMVERFRKELKKVKTVADSKGVKLSATKKHGGKRTILSKNGKRKRNSLLKMVKKVVAQKRKTADERKKMSLSKTPFRSKETLALLRELKGHKKVVKTHKRVTTNKRHKIKIVEKKFVNKRRNGNSFISEEKLKKLAREKFLAKIRELNISKSELKERLTPQEKKKMIESLKKQMAASTTNGGVM
jgi:hypothetical protein